METAATSTISLQPAQGEVLGVDDVHRPRPYPYHIDALDGSVLRQDLWEGVPARLAGFSVDAVEMAISIPTVQWLADLDTIERVTGMHPVLIDRDGTMWTDRRPVERVTVYTSEAVTA